MTYATLRDKIRAESAERKARYAEFERLWQKACAEGLRAGTAVVPDAMVVQDGRMQYHVADGVCGFAWVVLADARCSLARWAVRERGARKEYGGGLCLYWVKEFNQSMARKEAFAAAFARVFRTAGFDVYPTSRLD